MDIEQISDAALEQFSRFGAVLEGDNGNSVSNALSNGDSVVGPESVQQGLYQQDVERMQYWTGDATHTAPNSIFKPGLIGNSLYFLGGTLDAVTGVLGMAQQFHRDRVSGDGTYTGTMCSMLSSVAQMSLGSMAGWAVGGAAAAVFSGAAIPIVIGGAAAFAVSYGVGKLASL